MVETRSIKDEILKALERILPNENPDILTRKLDLVISVCESKKRQIKESSRI